MIALGRAALATGAFETNVPVKLFDEVWAVANDVDGDWQVARDLRPKVWPDLERMYAGVIPPLVKRQVWNANGFAADRLMVAYALGEWQAAADLLRPGGEGDGVDSAPHRAWAFAKMGLTEREATAEIAARTGPQRLAVTQAETLCDAGRRPAAVAAWTLALSKLPADDAGRLFVERRLREAEFLDKYEAAPLTAWVDLPTGTDWWDAVEGEWQPAGGDKVVCRVATGRRAADSHWGVTYAAPEVVFAPRVPAGYEIRMNVGAIRSQQSPPLMAGLLPAWGARRSGGIVINRENDLLRVFDSRVYDSRGPLGKITGDFTILRTAMTVGGGGDARVDGKPKSPDRFAMGNKPDPAPRRMAVVAFDGAVGDEFEVSRIQIRRLAPLPAK